MGQEVDENDSSEGAALVRELKREGVDTRYCRFWEGASVPSAWVLEAGVCVYFSPSPFLFSYMQNSVAIWDNRSFYHSATYDYIYTGLKRQGDRVVSLVRSAPHPSSGT